MSHYTIEELIAHWKREELTVEQMIGQMLQVLREQERRLRALGQNPAPDSGTPDSAARSPQR
jgi:hypothetical protein